MANPWFKFYSSDYLKEVKFLGVDANKRSCFLTALCYAAQNDGRIDTRYLTNDILKMESGVRMGGDAWQETGDVYQWLVEREIGHMEEHHFVFDTWEKRQEMYLTDAERARKYREKQKDEEPRDARHATVTQTFKNVTLDKKKNRIDKEEDKSIEYSTSFLSFWNEFPRKVGKGDAWKSWQRVPASLHENIIASVIEHRARDPGWLEGKYIPNPATYLNQRRWEDELPEEKSSPHVVKFNK